MLRGDVLRDVHDSNTLKRERKKVTKDQNIKEEKSSKKKTKNVHKWKNNMGHLCNGMVNASKNELLHLIIQIHFNDLMMRKI